jgi:KDO2-lipid IV(A) lauroyltransferase
MKRAATLLIRLTLLFFQIVPETLALALGRGVGLLWYHVLRYRRALVMDNLRQAFKGEKSGAQIRRIARNNFIHYGTVVIEFMRIPVLTKESLEKRIRLRGREHLQNALARGKGAILLCGHYGNWDMMAIAQAMQGINAYVITKRVKNEAIDSVWMRVRQSRGVRFISSEESQLTILKVLKTNQVLAIVFDQHRPGTMGVRVRFFGRPASTMRAVALLALRMKCAVVPVNYWRDEKGIHQVVFGEEAPLVVKETDEETIRCNTQVYNDILESYIRQHPEQWLWIHRRWK